MAWPKRASSKTASLAFPTPPSTTTKPNKANRKRQSFHKTASTKRKSITTMVASSVLNFRSLAAGRMDETHGGVQDLTRAAAVRKSFIAAIHNNNNNSSICDDEAMRYDVDISRTSSTETIDSDCSNSANEGSLVEQVKHTHTTTAVPFTEPDIYGQKHPIESDRLIADKLIDFDFEVLQLVGDSKVALLEAQRQCPELLTDKFKLMFLRCECFNAQKAAKRCAKYWEKRLEVFGPLRAFQPITQLSLMSEEDMRPLELGALHVIRREKNNTADNVGSVAADERDFLYVDPSKLQPTQYSREAGCRAFWFFIHCLLEDEQVQQRGLVVLNFCANFTGKNRDPVFARMCISSFIGCLPVRLSAYHGCHLPSLCRIVTQVLLTFIGERLRQRVMAHSGSYEKVVDQMTTRFLIPDKYIPADMGGRLQLDIRKWLAERN